jgi:hypothetical protein
LYQNVLHKDIIVGQGVDAGSRPSPLRSVGGWPIYLNGKADLPEFGEVTAAQVVGIIRYESLMTGMMDLEGQVQYLTAETEEAFLLAVGVFLEEDPFQSGSMMVEGEPEFALDFAAMVFKQDLPPETVVDGTFDKEVVLRELLLAHLMLFLGFDFHETRYNRIYFLENEEVLRPIFLEYLSLVDEGKLTEADLRGPTAG